MLVSVENAPVLVMGLASPAPLVASFLGSGPDRGLDERQGLAMAVGDLDQDSLAMPSVPVLDVAHLGFPAFGEHEQRSTPDARGACAALQRPPTSTRCAHDAEPFVTSSTAAANSCRETIGLAP